MSRLRLIPLAALAAACATNPATGRRQLSLISESQEIQMGREYDPQVAASMGLDPDTALQRYVQNLGAQLAARSERPSLPWTFRVVDEPVVNAFAIPGGYIYVTRGILAHFNSEAELASVLGHEIGHVTARHSASQMSRQQLAQVGLALGSIVSEDIEQLSGIASAALGVLFLKHSRDDERQADDLGLRYMRRTDYDVRAMPDVFTMLSRVSAAQPGGRAPEWLATHPNPENRRARIAQQIAAIPADSLGRRVNRDAYLRRIDGLVFGENPRDGFFRGPEFLHPGLSFRLRFPDGWTTQNQRQAVVAVTTERDATIQVTLAEQPSAEAAARAFFSQGQAGVTAGATSRGAINGLPAVSAVFSAATEGGELRGLAAFVEHGGRVFQLLGLAPAARWATHAAAAERTLRSFSVLTERAALDVQPWRIAVVSADGASTLEEFARRRPPPAPVSVATLALINQIEAGARLAAGTRLKWVIGQPRP